MSSSCTAWTRTRCPPTLNVTSRTWAWKKRLCGNFEVTSRDTNNARAAWFARFQFRQKNKTRSFGKLRFEHLFLSSHISSSFYRCRLVSPTYIYPALLLLITLFLRLLLASIFSKEIFNSFCSISFTTQNHTIIMRYSTVSSVAIVIAAAGTVLSMPLPYVLSSIFNSTLSLSSY